MSPPPPDHGDEYLDWFLSSAFETADEAGAEGPPVFAAPADEADDAEELPGRLGKYPVAERIGEGGIGLVYRVSDPELGRDLAIKVLRSAHVDNEDLVGRFMEEARICSRLQHPGVVPVHEMGRLEDGRPYFTMKIVDGHTLGRLLQDRGAPGRDVRRFLDIFERVCATLAFAHSHGTTHGDLTPRNVMVGAFGEVQVMDWGFARTAESAAARKKRRPDAPAPRIIGTPAYLSPEQAKGDREKVGPRTDVFGLGAILCEILTGAPPYLGETKADLLLRASKGWQDDARDRLRACGTDRALEDLCLRCLSPEISDRPEHAGVVAREIREYVSSLEERVRVLERENIAAVAVASQERRVRRLTTALGAVAFLAVIVPGAIYLKNVREQSALRAETEGSIARSMERAKLLLADERLEKTTDPQAFSEALKAAREAEVLALTPAAAPTSLPKARAMIEEVVRERERATVDRRTAELLRSLRLHFGDAQRTGSDGRTWSLSAADTAAEWNELTPAASPRRRMDHGMVAAGGDTILLFGGAPTKHGPLLNDTWSWDGATWTRLDPATVPPVRSGHAMSYDPVRDRVVLFSGIASTRAVLYHGDTWEWDGTDWQLMTPAHSPPRRDWSAMAYDPNRGVTILFGGRDSSHRPRGGYEPYGDTWAWDGVDWTPLSPSNAPPPRHGHGLVYDAHLDRLVLAGGQYPRAPGHDDTWAWDGSDWSELTPAAAYTGRAFLAMAFDEARGRTVLHGGKDVVDAVLLADTWEFDGSTWTRVSTTGPALGWFPAAYDATRRTVILKGGSISPTRFQNISSRFAAAFREYGIDTERMAAAGAAERMNASAIRQELIYALDEWTIVRSSSTRADDAKGRKLIRIANVVDSNAWRRKVRDSLEADDLERLRELAATTADSTLPASSLDLLASCLSIKGDHEAAIEVYRKACLRDPSDFNVHYKLADLLEFADPNSGDEVLRLVHIAVALQPDSVRALSDLARLLADRGEHERAISFLERAVDVEPDQPRAWYQLGHYLRTAGRPEEARRAFEESIRQGEWAAETDLALVLQGLGFLDEAIAAARHAVEMSPGQAAPQTVLGAILVEQTRYAEAIAALEESVRRDPLSAPTQYFLGRAYLALDRVAEARSSLRRSLELSDGAAEEQVAACRAWLEIAESRP